MGYKGHPHRRWERPVGMIHLRIRRIQRIIRGVGGNSWLGKPLVEYGICANRILIQVALQIIYGVKGQVAVLQRDARAFRKRLKKRDCGRVQI